MRTIEGATVSTVEVKRSKFIAHLVPMSDYKGLQGKLRREHPKANHVVYALRYLNEFDQIVENSSDDGEPKGSSGVPALNVLRGEELISCAVLIVRYFGGVKLGIGGLARAYGDVVKAVVSESDTLLYEKQHDYDYTTSYSDVQRIEYLLNQCGISCVEKEFGIQKVQWKIEATEEKLEAFKDKAGRALS